MIASCQGIADSSSKLSEITGVILQLFIFRKICCKRAPPYHSGLNIWKKNCNYLDSKNFVKSGLKNSPEQLLARFITETTGPRHNNKDYVCTLFSILKALCACTLPPLTCRCSKVDVSQIHMGNPVNDLKIAHIIACLRIFLWVQNLKLDIWTLETFLNMKKHMNAIICQKFLRKKIRKNFDLSDFLDFGY